jgi:hypothetical protein
MEKQAISVAGGINFGNERGILDMLRLFEIDRDPG